MSFLSEKVTLVEASTTLGLVLAGCMIAAGLTPLPDGFTVEQLYFFRNVGTAMSLSFLTAFIVYASRPLREAI